MGKLSDMRDRLLGRQRRPLVSTRIPSAAYADLPPAIAAKLKASARRVRRIVLFRGLCATVAVFVAAMLMTMAIDAMVVIFSPWVRWGLWSAAVGATLWTAWVSVIRPLARPFTPARMAAFIERNHPELEERLSTVVELIGTGDGAAASARLMEVLTADAVADAGKVSPRREFTARTVKPRLVAALAALGVVAALVAAFPRAMGRLITRAVVPSAEVDNIYASSLSVTPGDAVLLEGTPLTIQLAVKSGFPSKAYIRTRPRGGSETVERMARTSSDASGGGASYYTFYYPQVTRSFTYRLNCGSALTRGYTCTAVPVPAYTNLAVRLAYPAYTGRAPGVVTNAAPSPIATLAGTAVEVSARACRPGIAPTLLLPAGKTMAAEPDAEGNFSFAFTLEAGTSGSWGVQLVDGYGFSNVVEFASIAAVRDAAPTIRLDGMASLSYELPTFGQLPFAYTATDDFGFSYARLEMTDEKGVFVPAEDLAPEETKPGVWNGAGVIELARHKFGGRDTVKFRLAVADTLPQELGGPQKGYSAEITVRLVKDATSLEGKELAEQVKRVDATVEEVIRRLESAKRHANEARDSFTKPPNDWAYGERWKRLDVTKARLLDGERLLSELCANFDGTVLEAPGEVLKDALDRHVEPARRFCEEIYMAESDQKRAEDSQALMGRADDAIAALRQARQEFDRQAKEALRLQKLADFAEREETLAEMAREGEIPPDDWADRQEDLTREFEKTFADKLNDPLAREEEKVEALREAGEELKKKQEEIARDTAALKGDDAEARQKAEEDLKSKTRDMPADAAPEDRAARLEEDLARAIDGFADKTRELASQVRTREDEARRKEEEARRQAGGQSADARPPDAPEPPSAAQRLEEASAEMKNAAADARDASGALKAREDEKARQEMSDVGADLDKAAEKLAGALDALEERSDAMRGGNTKPYEEAHQDMKDAAREARHAAEEFAKAREAGELPEGAPEAQPEDAGAQAAQEPPGEQGEEGEQTAQEPGAAEADPDAQAAQADAAAKKAARDAAAAARDALAKARQSAADAARQLETAAQQKAGQMGFSQRQMQQLRQQMRQGRNGRFDPHGRASDRARSDRARDDGPFGRRNRNRGRDALLDGDLRDWFKSAGKSGANELEDMLQSVPAEYRELVREYFNELSKEAGK